MKEKISKKDIIRKIYLYAVTLVGLMMMVIPGVDMIRVSLETWVFPDVARQNYSYESMPVKPYIAEERLKYVTEGADVKLTEEEKIALENWKREYDAWQERQNKIDQVKINMQRAFVRDISTFIGGIILFLSHGAIIRRDRKNKKEEEV